jgi:hypothetical protein
MTNEANNSSLDAAWNEVDESVAIPDANDPLASVTDEESKKIDEAWNDDSVPETKVDDEPEDEKTPEEQAKEAKADDEKEKTPEQAKVYKAKFGDKLVEFPDYATIKVKANGKFITPTFKDLKDNYAGKVAWDEKLGAISESKKAIESEKMDFKSNMDNLNGHVKNMQEAATKGDIFSALEALANMVDINPTDFINTFHGAFERYFEEILTLEPEERNYKLLERKASMAENALNRRIKDDNDKIEVEKTHSFIKDLTTKNGVSEDEMKLSYRTMHEARNGDMSGVTPEVLVQLSLDGRIIDGLYGAIGEKEVELKKEDIEYLFEVVKAEQKRGGVPFSEENFLGIIDSYIQYQNGIDPTPVVDQASAQAVNRKVLRSNQPTRQTTPLKQGRELDFSGASSTDAIWDDLE